MKAVNPSVSADLEYWDTIYMRGELPPAPHYRLADHLIRELPKNARVFVAGSGAAQVPIAVAKKRPDIGWQLADQSAVALERALVEAEVAGLDWRRSVSVSECDLSGTWPQADDSADVVLAIGLLEFLPNPPMAIAEAQRVARSLFVCTMPVKPADTHRWYFEPIDPWRMLNGDVLIRAHHLMAHPGCILAFVTL